MITGEIENNIEKIITPALEEQEYNLVRVKIFGGQTPTLQIMAEHKDGSNINISECTKINKIVSALLEENDPLPGFYNLEISSAGMDRPLVKPQDFTRFTGEAVKIALHKPLEGKKRFRGILKGLENDKVILNLSDNNEDISLPFAEINEASILITDELLKKAAQKQN